MSTKHPINKGEKIKIGNKNLVSLWEIQLRKINKGKVVQVTKFFGNFNQNNNIENNIIILKGGKKSLIIRKKWYHQGEAGKYCDWLCSKFIK